MDELIIKEEFNSDRNELPETSTSHQANKNARVHLEDSSTIVRKKFKLIPNEVNSTNADVSKEFICNNKNQNKETGNSNFNEEAITLLKAILEKQNILEIRMSNLEEAVNKNTILVQAQNKLSEESEAIRKKLYDSFSCMTGDVEEILNEEICITLPLTTIEQLDQIEDRLQNNDYAQAMKAHLYKRKGSLDDIDMIFRNMFSDALISNYNWDGRLDKKVFSKLTLINKILFDVFKEQGHINLVKSMKKCISLSHNRYKQRKHVNRFKNVTL